MNFSKENIAAQYVNRFINATNQHVFLTGKAGTGKTTLLKEIINTTHKKALIAAPTGIAAINAGGVTLHSLFHLPFGTFLPDNKPQFTAPIQNQVTTPSGLIKNLHMNKNKRALIADVELLIIDEVSMLRADLLDAIDTILRYVRRTRQPFGGLQILFIGDLWQLPPVVKDDEKLLLTPYYKNIFFFNALALKNNPPVYIELNTIYRQSDQQFINLLNHFRVNEVSPSDIELLNQNYQPNFKIMQNPGYIYLTTHNYKADAVNRKALESLNGEIKSYNAKTEGEFSEYAYPVDFTLELKKDAQVMFIKNDYSGENAYYNGKIGKVKTLSKDFIEVAFDDGSKPAYVEPYAWENKKFALNKETREIEETIVGKFIHFPLKLAWAITIHKSQGLTFDKAMLDISDAFAPGQIYVALSRLTSVQGLVLARPIKREGPDMDDALYQFTQSQKPETELEHIFEQSAQQYLQSKVSESFNFKRLLLSIQEHIESYNKDATKSNKQKYLTWALELKNSLKPLVEVSVKFQSQLGAIMQTQDDNYLNKLYERVEAARLYFQPQMNDLMQKIVAHKTTIKKETGIKKYLTELDWLEGEFFEMNLSIRKAEALCLSALKNTQLNKQTVQELSGALKKEFPQIEAQTVKNKSKKDKTEKIDTRVATFDLYKEGLSLEQIAEKRGMSPRTIEGHLADCVEKGLIEIDDLVPIVKQNIIMMAIEQTGIEQLSPIKEVLGDTATYTEIKYVVAYIKYEQSMADE
jgi:DNA-binding transcriptional ArsR family regulator